MATTDTERYVRITLLTFEGGIWIGKKILCREIDRTPGSPTITVLVHSRKQVLIQKRNRREITKKQFETLFPTSGADTSVEDWDLSLLVKMILFLFEPALPGQEKSDLNHILRIRNEVVCHARGPSVREHEFTTHWTQLTISICTLASSFDEDTKRYSSDLIQKLSSGPLDLQSSLEKLAQLCRNDEHMENVLASLARVERTQNKIAAGVDSANRKLDDVLAGVMELIRVNDLNGQGDCRVEIPILNSKVCIIGKKEDIVKLAEDIVLKVLKSALDNADDPNDNEKIKNAVQQFLGDLESKDAVADSAHSGSIILNIRCTSLNGLANMLNLFRIDGHRYRLVGLENALNELLQDELKVDLVLPDEVIERIADWIDVCLSSPSGSSPEDLAPTGKINLGIKCNTVESAVDVIKYFESGDAANRLNQLSEALSETFDDTIRIDVALDIEGFTEALRASLASAAADLSSTTPIPEEEPRAAMQDAAPPSITFTSEEPRAAMQDDALPPITSMSEEKHREALQEVPPVESCSEIEATPCLAADSNVQIDITEPMNLAIDRENPQSPISFGGAESRNSGEPIKADVRKECDTIPRTKHRGQSYPLSNTRETHREKRRISVHRIGLEIESECQTVWMQDQNPTFLGAWSVIKGPPPFVKNRSAESECDTIPRTKHRGQSYPLLNTRETHREKRHISLPRIELDPPSPEADFPSGYHSLHVRSRSGESGYELDRIVVEEISHGRKDIQSHLIRNWNLKEYLSGMELTKNIQEKILSECLNRLDPDEAPSYSAPHLDPNCLQRSEDESDMARVGRALRRYGDEIGQNAEMDRLIQEAISSQPSRASILEIVSQTLADGITWGRIIALSHFGARVAYTSLKRMGSKLYPYIFMWPLLVAAEEANSAIQMHGGVGSIFGHVGRSLEMVTLGVEAGLLLYIGYRIFAK